MSTTESSAPDSAPVATSSVEVAPAVPATPATTASSEEKPFPETGILSLLNPGVSNKLLRWLDLIFVVMMASLLFLIVSCHLMGWVNIHVYIMFFLGIGLIVSFKWFMSMVGDQVVRPESSTAAAPTAVEDKKKD
ncbi:hypothetical protein PAPYR_5112 [Paratrimastix pyriformis]|uniref:Transmembrane protein n=1 Tax=Paratrimastix pyriformis TaxID=342808 RepID=A0ABQ8UIK1_9EUKA|nr:hypothetical protein PAPYR_5112 [Paratrimastix pyriformis]